MVKISSDKNVQDENLTIYTKMLSPVKVVQVIVANFNENRLNSKKMNEQEISTRLAAGREKSTMFYE